MQATERVRLGRRVGLGAAVAVWSWLGAGCGPSLPVYTVAAPGSGETGTLLVSSRLRLLRIGSRPAEQRGDSGAAYVLQAGTHRLVFKVDYSTQQFGDESWWTYATGELPLEVEITAGRVHAVRAAMTADGVRLMVSSGPNPLPTPGGAVVTVAPERAVIEVRRGGSGTEYELLTNSLSYSPDGLHAVFLAYFTGAFTNYARVVVDGAEGPDIGGVVDNLWSADSRHFAYVALGSMMWSPRTVYVDGAALGEFEELVDVGRFFFDETGALVFGGMRDGTWYLIRGRSEEGLASRGAVEEALARLRGAP